eukprot:CAMPEP_0184861306 /NCGR_PEP_ID=MMETSP0580-20130426/6013_1 /TAXON_ID=1118495 /ORGANISM="Dactyliosolen fragilissimus" /LENGTH=955 /DNA_ID=CAMNT_0027358735 /DNA_START=40 /DNA_END=2907 /DNA_ORIENTATION=-
MITREDLMNKRHDEFRNSLINDVFVMDNEGKVPMDKVMLLIWQCRDDTGVVEFMAKFVAKHAHSRDVFDGIEFYLPQFAHMMIHLEANWTDSILETLALIISQHSIHFALQLNWILEGAIEDYQPETPEGKPNEDFNPLYYSRCIKLLCNIERCVVYGTPRRHELQRLYEKNQISMDEYLILEQSDARFNAAQIADNVRDSVIDSKTGLLIDTKITGGELLYKRHVRTSRCKTKPWKTRYFAVHERMLYCYNRRPTEGGRLVRAMPLEGAKIHKTRGKAKYKHMFEVHNLHFFFRMRAKDDSERDMWINLLKEESESSVLYPHQSRSKTSFKDTQLKQSTQIIDDLNQWQKARYDFFKDERDFVRSLCDLAEDLRFKNREERKQLAPGLAKGVVIPPTVYVPMCNSTDIWRRVGSTIPEDTRVFNTKERCPVILYFVTKRGEKLSALPKDKKDVNLDVAEYMRFQFGADVEAAAPPKAMAPINENPEIFMGIESTLTEDEEGGINRKSVTISMEPSSTRTQDDSDSDDSDQMSSVAMVWAGPSKQPKSSLSKSGVRVNAQASRVLRERFAKIPVKVSSSLRNIKKSRSSKQAVEKSMIEQVSMSMVPIVETKMLEDDDCSVVSNLSGSMKTADGGILQIENEKDGIESQCLQKSKSFICGNETWAEKTERLLREVKDSSGEATSEIYGVMAKSNDDLRQEMFVMQMIHYYKSVFANANLPIWLRTYRILSTSKSTGLIEVLMDATSIDGLKKSDKYPKEGGMRAYFEMVYGKPTTDSFRAAQKNFMTSLVGYSLVSYLIGLKDRHNGNIMIDLRGHLIHIDFGFAMGMAPGHEFSFERAPFKLTKDYMDVMGGKDSDCFKEFRRLFVEGFKAARANSQIALGLVEIMMYKSNFPCFTGSRYGGGIGSKRFQDRLMLRVEEQYIEMRANNLIDMSINNKGTKLYDQFQKLTNGYEI